MTPAHARKVLPIYRANQKKYDREENAERADIQKRLIARLEKDAKE